MHYILKMRTRREYTQRANVTRCNNLNCLIVKSYKNFTTNTTYLGITASKKSGNAVKRNRSKRRIRAAIKQFEHIYMPGISYVFIATTDTALCAWSNLIKDFENGVLRCNAMHSKYNN